ncbi:Amino-acid carrier protein AlsT [Marinomonas spartinae]|uniref:alanine/glycine:cation symporter family protein n=1 Tax=Marinomonas spartinae TaxID=1792290 RepID=UPI000808ED3E|nr:alanine/glycine:cation symporter family protein [Marinomonas spartinae]SBS25901.1 Amino-acid carrier protein AlsT [Marinomonas spartinae]
MLVQLTDLLWSYVLIALLIAVGLGFTLSSRFVQFRFFGRMFSVLFGKKEAAKNGQLTSFQALVLSVAGRVGGGNIAGVAVAITIGGPGAIFWMWLVGLMGMATSFFECTLAQAYKTAEPDGSFRGGPAQYISRGIGANWRPLSIVYSILLLITFGVAFTGVQSYAVATSLQDAFHIPLKVSGLALAVVIALIIFGGVKRIARIAEILVPVMAIGYLLLALIVLVMNVTAIPHALELIVKSAFGLGPAVGGGMGAAIMMGMKRGLFSNEAGLGSAPNVAATAFVPHPVNQGIVQSFSVFIDTILLCTCTALIILLGTNYDPASTSVAAGGVALTQASLATHLGESGRIFVSIALLLFGFSTILYNYYLGENSLAFLFRKGKGTLAVMVFRLAVILLCGLGAVANLNSVFAFSDLTMGLLAVANLTALIMLFKKGLRILKHYEDQLKKGIESPVFAAADLPELNLDDKAWPAQTVEKK